MILCIEMLQEYNYKINMGNQIRKCCPRKQEKDQKDSVLQSGPPIKMTPLKKGFLNQKQKQILKKQESQYFSVNSQKAEISLHSSKINPLLDKNSLRHKNTLFQSQDASHFSYYNQIKSNIKQKQSLQQAKNVENNFQLELSSNNGQPSQSQEYQFAQKIETTNFTFLQDSPQSNHFNKKLEKNSNYFTNSHQLINNYRTITDKSDNQNIVSNYNSMQFKITDQENNVKDITQIRKNIGMIKKLIAMQDYNKALQYVIASEQAIKLIQRMQQIYFQAQLFYQKGQIYARLNNLSKSHHFYDQAIKITASSQYQNKEKNDFVCQLFASKAELFLIESKIPRAKKYLILALKSASQNQQHLAFVHSNLGHIYNSEQEYPQAEKHYNKALNILENKKIENQIYTQLLIATAQVSFSMSLVKKAINIYIKLFKIIKSKDSNCYKLAQKSFSIRILLLSQMINSKKILSQIISFMKEYFPKHEHLEKLRQRFELISKR